MKSMLSPLSRGALLACAVAASVAAQSPGEPADRSTISLRYATFDPALSLPEVPAPLRSGKHQNLRIVQFHGTPTQAGRDAVAAVGGKVIKYLPRDAYVVEMTSAQAAALKAPMIRWVGEYHPAFRLEDALLESGAVQSGAAVTYNMVVADKHTDKPALASKIAQVGGVVVNEHAGSLLFTATLTGPQLLQVAGFDEVLWIDRWSAPEEDMDNARVQGGGNYVETVGGFTGTGVNTHIYEGLEATHPDFTGSVTVVNSSNSAATHGHCTAGIVFGNGTSNPAVRGMAPDAGKFFTNYGSVSTSRWQVFNDLVNVHNVSHTTASWGGARTFFYTSVSADSDDITFDNDITWTQSQSNAGNQDSRPQAWAKNVFSIGGVNHQDDSNPNNDSWQNGGASIGPASDGRIKPTMCAYYDNIGASDRTGSAGYSSGNWTSGFGGTSGATPIVAGHNTLAIQMYTTEVSPGVGLFGQALRVPGGTAHQNRPHAPTLKALQVVSAAQYSFTASSSDNRREHQGWGFPGLQTMYDDRGETLIIDETDVLTQGQSSSYTIAVSAGQPSLRACLNWLEPAANPSASSHLINNLSLRATSPSGTVYWGNNNLESGVWSTPGGSEDGTNSIECVFVQSPAAGNWTVEVLATAVVQDNHVETALIDADYALVVVGGAGSGGGPGGGSPLTTTFASNNGGVVGGAVYFSLQALPGTGGVTISDLDLNVNGASTSAGTPVSFDLYVQPNSGSCTFDVTGSWFLRASGTGVAAGTDNPTNFVLSTPLQLGDGCCLGVAIVATNFAHRYTTGTTNPTAYANGQLQLIAGRASNTPFSAPVFEPRVVNTNVNYTLGGTCDDAAVATAYGAGCVESRTSFYEQLTQASMDLSGLEIYGTASAGGHTCNTRPSTIMAIGSLGAPIQLALGDDDSVAAGTLGLEVGSNGWVARGGGNSTNWVPDVSTMLTNPSEGYYAWTDLQPNAAASGKVYYEESGTQWMVTYDDVFLWNTSDVVTIQFRGDESTRDFVIAFGALANTGPEDWLVGHSGAGSSVDPGPRNLSQGALFGFFMGDQDLSGLELAAVGSPVLGAPFQLQTTNIPATAVFHVGVVGLSQITVPLAIAAPSANPACSLYATSDVLLGPQVVWGGPGTLTWQGIDLTSASALGASLYFQSATLDLSVLSGSTRTSNGVAITTGLY